MTAQFKTLSLSDAALDDGDDGTHQHAPLTDVTHWSLVSTGHYSLSAPLVAADM